MPFHERGDVRIHYETAGDGFPLLVIPGGGLNSDLGFMRKGPFDPLTEFRDDYRCVASDLQRAHDLESAAAGGAPDRCRGHRAAQRITPGAA